MKFELDVLDAKRGDCLIVNFAENEGDDTKHILIDGGYYQVYETRLAPRLAEMREASGQDTPIEFEVAMLSHIDADHIVGLIKLTDAIIEENSGNASPALIKKCWHNTFAKLTGDTELSSILTMGDDIVTASTNGEPFPFPGITDDRAEFILASIRQGDKLSENLRDLGLDGNPPFEHGLALAGETYFENGMDILILGPSLERLNELREEWDPDSDPIELAELTDSSVANLSSIIALMMFGGKSVLLTGDARGDDILKGVTDAGLLEDGVFKVDVLKMPHHGSIRNVDMNFFKTIVADVYIYSADGAHDNPDAETLALMRNSRQDSNYTVVLSNEMTMQHEENQPVFDAEVQALKDSGVTVLQRDPDMHSICLNLLNTPVSVC